MRRAARIDANQPALVKLIRKLGGSFQHTHQIPGALDGIIGYHGVDIRVEFKDPDQPPSKRALTKAEIDTIDEWKGRPPVVIETAEHVIALFERIKWQ